MMRWLLDRMTLLKNVPFLRFLSEEDKAAIINDEKACKVMQNTTVVSKAKDGSPMRSVC